MMISDKIAAARELAAELAPTPPHLTTLPPELEAQRQAMHERGHTAVDGKLAQSIMGTYTIGDPRLRPKPMPSGGTPPAIDDGRPRGPVHADAIQFELDRRTFDGRFLLRVAELAPEKRAIAIEAARAELAERGRPDLLPWFEANGGVLDARDAPDRATSVRRERDGEAVEHVEYVRPVDQVVAVVEEWSAIAAFRKQPVWLPLASAVRRLLEQEAEAVAHAKAELERAKREEQAAAAYAERQKQERARLARERVERWAKLPREAKQAIAAAHQLEIGPARTALLELAGVIAQGEAAIAAPPADWK